MLEVKIDELIVAVRELTLAMSLSVIAKQPQNEMPGFTPDTSQIVQEREQKIVAQEVDDAKKPEVKQQTTTDTSPSSEPEFSAVTYDDVKKLIIAISKQSKEKAVAALSRLGVTNGKELKPEQWAYAAEYLTAVANGIDPESSDA